MKSGVYIIEHKINGKIYIGSSKDILKRWKSHVNRSFSDTTSNMLITRAIKKHGVKNFEFRVLEYVTSEELLVREQHYLDALNPFGSNGYNICKNAGNSLGTKRTEEQKKRLRKLHKSLGTGTWMKGSVPWNKGKSYSSPEISAAKLGKSIGEDNHKSKTVIFLSPEGQETLFESINSGASQRGLNVSAMAEVARGVRKHHKGWTFLKNVNS